MIDPHPGHARAFAGLGSLGLVLLLQAGPAAAQDRPPAQPTRDVAVTYAGGPNGPMHMAWLAAAHLSRSEIAPGIWSLHDEARHATVVVSDARKAVLAMPMSDPMQVTSSPDASFTRDGTATIAGVTCTSWVIHDHGADAKACIAADGVLLRMDAAAMTLTATEVSYAPQDPGRFAVPTGYTHEGAP